MDVLLFRALSLLGLAILVALAARRLRLPYTVGLVLAGAALAATRSNTSRARGLSTERSSISSGWCVE